MKILIISTEDSQQPVTVAKSLQSSNDDLAIAPIFITDMTMKGKVSETEYYMSNEEAELSYKNDSFMWVRTNTKNSRGVTKPDMYTSSIFTMSFADFNNMSNPVLEELDKNDDLVICVIDEGRKKHSAIDIRESNAAFERIYNYHYLYFLDEKNAFISDMILRYVSAPEKEREMIERSLNS